MAKLFIPFFLLGMFLFEVYGQNQVTVTYISGVIPTDYNFRTLPGFSTCPGILKVNIPEGNEISGVDVSYTMDGIGYPFQQRSWLYCPTVSAGEGSIISGVGEIKPYNYSRNGLTFANLVTGEVEFQLHAGRTYGRSGCDTLYNKVVNNTWVLTVHFVPLPDCAMPYPLSADVNGTSVDLGWTPRGSETSWNAELGLPGFTPGTGNEILKNYGMDSPSWEVTGLTPLTSYEFYVQSDCGGGEYSEWSGPHNFSTGCGGFPVPFFEGFEEGHILYSTVAKCWSQESISGTSDWRVNNSSSTFSFPNNGSFYGYLAAESNYWMFQAIKLEAGKNYTFKMYARQDGGNPGKALITVAYGNISAAAGMNSMIVPETQITNSEYQPLTGTFTVPVDGSYFIGINGNNALNSQCYIYIDDISIYETIPGTKPVSLGAVNIDYNSADLKWICGAGEYEIEWGISPFSPGTGNGDNTSENTYLLSGLNESTVYEFYVRAVWGPGEYSAWAGPYRFATEQSVPAVEVTGSNNADGQYMNLKKAFDAINAADQTGKEIDIAVTGDSYEGVKPSALYEGNWSNLTIFPMGAPRIIYGNVDGNPLIDINSADRVTINGYLDGINYGLTIVNYSVSSDTGTSTLRFINDAQYNKVQYCKLLGASTTPPDTDGGTVYFATSVKYGWGNSRDTITNCIIGPVSNDKLPSKGIYARSYAPQSWENYTNRDNVIRNNEIYDFYRTGGCAGIFIRYGNGAWIIEDNKIFQTSSRNMSGMMYGIYFSNQEYDAYKIRNINRNIIGFSSNNQSGTLSLTGNGSFAGIAFNILQWEKISIQDNLISDISLTSSAGTFYGIQNFNTSGNNYTLDINRNVIRRINIYNTIKTQCGLMAGHAKDLTVTGNCISDIVSSGNGEIYGVVITSSLNGKINNNNVFNISCTNPEFSQVMAGIKSTWGNAGNYPLEFKNNNIYNFSSYSSSEHLLAGILKAGNYSDYGKFTFQYDSIYNFKCHGGGANITGMHISFSYTWIRDNVIFDLASTSVNSTGVITGIYTSESSGVHFFERNKVFHLSTSGENSSVCGVHIGSAYNASIRLYNNLISDLQAPNANAEIPLCGIKISNGGYSTVMFNTLYLDASSVGETFGSAGIFADNASYIDLRNNNIVNTSVPNGTGKTVSFRNHDISLANYPQTSNNNNFYAGIPGENNLIFYDGTNADESVESFRARVTLRDDASFSELPHFLNIAEKPYDLHIDKTVPTRLESSGVKVLQPEPIESDIDADTRYVFPDVGADEFDGIPTMPVHPAGASAKVMNTQKINVSYETNVNGDDVLIVWNTTGIFNAPDGVAPAAGEPFAGGYVLSAGIPSPVSHTGLTPSSKYYYKLFSFSGTDYSPGIVISATTNLDPPVAFSATSASDSQIDLVCSKNASGNNIFIVVNTSDAFGIPVNGVPVDAGDNITGGGTVIYLGSDTVYNHSALTEYTQYFYKVWTVDEYYYFSSTGLTSDAMTSCKAVSLPFTEGFETNHTDFNPVENCWTHQNISGWEYWTANSYYKDSNAPRTGEWNALLRGNADSSIFRGFLLEGGKNYTVELYARQEETNPEVASVSIACGIVPNAAGMTEIIIPLTGLVSGGYQFLTGNFTPVASGTYYIGIRGVINGGIFSSIYIAIDDISIFSSPTCLVPLSLSAGEITSGSAVLTWTAGGSETTWNVEVGSPGFTPGNNEEINGINGINNNTWTADGLDPFTVYDFYVQADCGEGDLSTWGGPHSFKTICGSSSIPFSETFSTYEFPPCWSQTYEGTLPSDKWTIYEYYSAGGSSPYEIIGVYNGETGTARLISPPVNLSSVSDATLSFRHFIYDPGAGCAFKVQSGTDGVNWIDESFALISGQGNIGPVEVSIPITTHSLTTYISWVIEGNNPGFFHWSLDDILITGTEVGFKNIEITDPEIKVYPNPSEGEFIIKTNSTWNLQIIDTTGKIVLIKRLEEGNNEVKLKDQPAGIYLLKLINDLQLQTIKIVIN